MNSVWTRSDAAGFKEGGLEVQEKEWGALVCVGRVRGLSQ